MTLIFSSSAATVAVAAATVTSSARVPVYPLASSSLRGFVSFRLTAKKLLPPLRSQDKESSVAPSIAFDEAAGETPSELNHSRSEQVHNEIGPLVKAASFAPIVPAEVDVSKDGIRRKKLAVFVSGGGSNFKKIHEHCSVGSIKGDVVLLVTNKRDCGGAEYARSNGIPVLVFPKGKREPSDGLSSKELVDVLRKYGVDFVLLAGYLKLMPVELVQAFPKRILNIHPALLPAFGGKGLYGVRVHKAVLASGARYSGPTIHFVDEEYDTGRILAQSAVRVNANDTPEELAKRVLHEEHKLYVEVVAAICEERIKWREDGVPLIQSKENSDEYY